jgi:acyl dehydratase
LVGDYGHGVEEAQELTSTTETTLVAYNRAAVDNPNRVHDAEFARSVGFPGGLVPGVDVFAYLARAPLTAWGSGWLGEGGLEARFVQPVCDGDAITIRASRSGDAMGIEAVNADGIVCARATAERRIADPAPDSGLWPELPLPTVPMPATPGALGKIAALGSLQVTVSEEDALRQLSDVREPSDVYARERVVHPGHLLRFADSILAANVLLPPWMHVSSRARFFRTVRWGEPLSVRALRRELFERKGHQFVQLDVLIAGADGPVLRVEPYTAIYRPAWTRSS